MVKNTGQMIVHVFQQGQDATERDPDYSWEVQLEV